MQVLIFLERWVNLSSWYKYYDIESKILQNIARFCWKIINSLKERMIKRAV